jgi:hypothetical protein
MLPASELKNLGNDLLGGGLPKLAAAVANWANPKPVDV